MLSEIGVVQPKFFKIDFNRSKTIGFKSKSACNPFKKELLERKKTGVKFSSKLFNVNQSILIAYSRIPNKYDHFHEKTYESSYMPTITPAGSTKTSGFSTYSRLEKLRESLKNPKPIRIQKQYIMPASVSPRKIRLYN